MTNGRISQHIANEERNACLLKAKDRPTANIDNPTIPVVSNDIQAPATGQNRSSSVAGDSQFNAQFVGNVASASESGAASCEALRPGQNLDRGGDFVENRSKVATELAKESSSSQSLSSSRARPVASVTTEDLPVLPEPPARTSDEEATSTIPGQASIGKLNLSMPMPEVPKGRSSCEAEDCFTRPSATETRLVGHSDHSPRPTATETCEHEASHDTHPNESPESLAHSNDLPGSFSMSSGSRSSKCVSTTLAADEDASACQTTNKRDNGRAIAGSKRKYAKKTLLSTRFRQKQDAALQVAWVETQSIWLRLRLLLQGPGVEDSALQPHTSALDTKFQNLCAILFDKECVDDPALVLDVVSAWRTVQELLSPEHDPQNTAGQFERQLAVFQEQVYLQIDIGKCLDEEQGRRKKVRHRRA